MRTSRAGARDARTVVLDSIPRSSLSSSSDSLVPSVDSEAWQLTQNLNMASSYRFEADWNRQYLLLLLYTLCDL